MPSESTGSVLIKDNVSPAHVYVDAEFHDVISVNADDATHLKAYFKGNPMPVIVWERDGVVLKPNNKTSMNVSNEICLSLWVVWVFKVNTYLICHSSLCTNLGVIRLFWVFNETRFGKRPYLGTFTAFLCNESGQCCWFILPYMEV